MSDPERWAKDMKPNASKSWRAEGDDEAFDHTSWEFKAQQFLHSAKRLLELIEEAEKKPSIDLFTCRSLRNS